jgi:hypothetical protein
MLPDHWENERLLTMTKKGKERKDWGVTAR